MDSFVMVFLLTTWSQVPRAATKSCGTSRLIKDSSWSVLITELASDYDKFDEGMYALQPDIANNNQLLGIFGHATIVKVATTNWTTVPYIGAPKLHLNTDNGKDNFGVGWDAQFKSIIDMTQISKTTLIVLDVGHNCLKNVDRLTLAVSRYSGVCSDEQSSTHFDGPSLTLALYKNPKALTVFNRKLYIVDNISYIRTIDLDDRRLAVRTTIERSTVNQEILGIHVISVDQILIFTAGALGHSATFLTADCTGTNWSVSYQSSLPLSNLARVPFALINSHVIAYTGYKNAVVLYDICTENHFELCKDIWSAWTERRVHTSLFIRYDGLYIGEWNGYSGKIRSIPYQGLLNEPLFGQNGERTNETCRSDVVLPQTSSQNEIENQNLSPSKCDEDHDNTRIVATATVDAATIDQINNGSGVDGPTTLVTQNHKSFTTTSSIYTVFGRTTNILEGFVLNLENDSNITYGQNQLETEAHLTDPVILVTFSVIGGFLLIAIIAFFTMFCRRLKRNRIKQNLRKLDNSRTASSIRNRPMPVTPESMPENYYELTNDPENVYSEINLEASTGMYAVEVHEANVYSQPEDYTGVYPVKVY